MIPPAARSRRRCAVDDLRVRLGSNEILRGVSYAVRPGRIAALLGRSGSGKTTLLRCVAGLETPTAGSIAIGETQVFDAGRGIDVPTERRNLGLVFQSYALWPHKTVFDNVAYGLRVRGAARADIEARVAEVLQGVGLGALGARFPHQLSGGQQQRVALARAFAYGPPVILLDEPLSNLDAKLREESRIWVRGLIKRLGLTAVFVTHDQVEAMAIADEVVLIEEGRIVQAGTPQQLYDEPATLFVAEFMGSNNVLHGRIAERRAGDACLDLGGLRLWGRDRSAAPAGATGTAVIRLDRVAVLERAGDNCLAGELESSVFLGERWESLFAVAGQPVRVFHQAPLAPGAALGPSAARGGVGLLRRSGESGARPRLARRLAGEKRREPAGLHRLGGVCRHGGGVDCRELEPGGERAGDGDAGRAQHLGDLGAADRTRASRRGERAHRRGAVRKRLQARRDRLADAEPVEHLGEMDAGRRLPRIGEIDRVGGKKRCPQRIAVGDRRRRVAGPHRDGGEHGSDIGRGALDHTTFARQLGDQRRGQDQEVRRRAGAELCRHGADGAELALDPAAGLGLEGRRQRSDEPLRRAAAQEREPGHRARHRGEDALARQRQVAHPHAERVEHGVGDRGRGRPMRRLAGADGLLLGPRDDLDLDRRHLGEASGSGSSPRRRS